MKGTHTVVAVGCAFLLSRVGPLLQQFIPPLGGIPVIDNLPLAPAISTSFGIVVLWATAWLVITRRLVWHTDLKKSEDRGAAEVRKEAARGDKWEGIALRALGVAEKMTVHAEVANEVLTQIPVPVPAPGPQPPDITPEGSP